MNFNSRSLIIEELESSTSYDPEQDSLKACPLFDLKLSTLQNNARNTFIVMSADICKEVGNLEVLHCSWIWN